MMMISNTGHKRKSTSSEHSNATSTIGTNNNNNNNNNNMSTMTKRFRGIAYDGKNNEQRMSLLSTATIKSEQSSSSTRKMIVPTIVNGDRQHHDISRKFDETQMTPVMLAEYRRLQHELQCQEAMLVLMQKLKSNQKLASSSSTTTTTTANNSNTSVKQRPTVVNATKLSVQNHQQQSLVPDSKAPLTATKQQPNSLHRSTPSKTLQYASNRSNNQSQQVQQQQQQSSKIPVAPLQATRQANSGTPPAAATRISSTIPPATLKTSSSAVAVTSSTGNSSKSNGIAAEQHLLNAKLALRKQLEQTLLQIPTPKPSTCDLTFMPGVNGWSEFLAMLGLEQALNSYTDIVYRRPPSEMIMNLPYNCSQCGTDWSVTWHETTNNIKSIPSGDTTTTTNTDESTNNNKILCDRCTKTSQKKLLKQDHSNRLRQAFIKALQQEKELDAKFQQQTSSSTTTPSTTAVKQQQQPPSSLPPPPPPPPPPIPQQQSKHLQSTKHSNKPLSTKTSSSNHHNNNHHHHSHHHHHHSGKSSSSINSSNTSSSSSSKLIHNSNPSSSSSSLSALNATPSPAEALASTLAALQSTEQMEFFQKHFLSNMLPFAAVANQAALAAKTVQQQQQQQQQALASLPAMAAAVMRQQNPAQYLLDMIPQAAKHHHHHHHSK